MKVPENLYDWIKSTPSYKHSSMMDSLINKLKQEHNITFFHYARRLPNGTYFELTTDRNWGLCYVEKYLESDTFTTLQHLNENIWIWGENVTDKKELLMHQERTEVYKIPKGVSFIIGEADTLSYSSRKFSDKERIDSIIHVRNEELQQLEKSFLLTVEPIIKEFSKENRCYNKDSHDIYLTQKEMTILGFLSKGFRSCEIAKLLNITEGTLKNKFEIIKDKMYCNTKEQAVALAIKNGYIS
ncbi:MAG: LuxR C-terminal-related transcriptional regulator [Gammaproteobacteria bacterium]